MKNTGHRQRLNRSQRAGFFKQGLGMFKAALTGRYEGAKNTRARKTHSVHLASGDDELDYGASDQLISRARDLEQNVGLVAGVNRKIARHVVGTCEMQWATGDDEVNKAYEEAWRMAMKMLDARGVHHFRTLTLLAVQSATRDGDIFGQVINDASERFALSMIEADRVRTIGGYAFSADEPYVKGGVELDKMGRPLAFRVWERQRHGSSFKDMRRVPASDMLHIWDPTRVDSNRGVTKFAPVLNHLIDLKETIEAEVASNKTLSKMSLLVKNQSGSAENTTGLDDETTTEGNTIKVEEIAQDVISYMFPGEDIKAFQSDRPSPAWQGLVELVIRLIAQGFGLPYSVVWSFAGLTGPAVRADLAEADRVFSDLHDLLMKQWFGPIVGRVIGQKIANKELPFHENWHRFQSRRPRKLTIDIGRDTNADIAAMDRFLIDEITWSAEAGQDYRQVVDRQVSAYEMRKKAAEDRGYDVNEVFRDRKSGTQMIETTTRP